MAFTGLSGGIVSDYGPKSHIGIFCTYGGKQEEKYNMVSLYAWQRTSCILYKEKRLLGPFHGLTITTKVLTKSSIDIV